MHAFVLSDNLDSYSFPKKLRNISDNLSMKYCNYKIFPLTVIVVVWKNCKFPLEIYAWAVAPHFPDLSRVLNGTET
jgi:hypothetical protein